MMKRLTIRSAVVVIIGICLLFLGAFSLQAKAKTVNSATFPSWVRGSWYEYHPGDGYAKITFSATKIRETKAPGIMYSYLTEHDSQGHFVGRRPVEIQGRRFTAFTSPTSHHGRASMVSGYWRIRKAYVKHRWRTELCSSGGAGWDIWDTYAFRSKVHYQAKWMYPSRW